MNLNGKNALLRKNRPEPTRKKLNEDHRKLLKFTAASWGSPCDSTALVTTVLNVTTVPALYVRYRYSVVLFRLQRVCLRAPVMRATVRYTGVSVLLAASQLHRCTREYQRIIMYAISGILSNKCTS